MLCSSQKKIIPRSCPSCTAGSLICISLEGEGEDKQIRKETKRSFNISAQNNHFLKKSILYIFQGNIPRKFEIPRVSAPLKCNWSLFNTRSVVITCNRGYCLLSKLVQYLADRVHLQGIHTNFWVKYFQLAVTRVHNKHDSIHCKGK